MRMLFRSAPLAFAVACTSIAGCFLTVDFGDAHLANDAGATGGTTATGGTGPSSTSAMATTTSSGGAAGTGGSSSSSASSGTGGGMPTYADVVLSDAPLAYWHLDDAASPAVDATGNGHDATVAGGASLPKFEWQQAGVLGTAAGFASTNCQYLTLGSSSFNFAAGAPFTLEVWAYPTQLPTSSNALAMIDKEDFTPPRQGYGFRSNGNGVVLERYISGTNHPIQGPALQANQWTHVVVTVDANGTMILYENGKPVGTTLTFAGGTDNSGVFNIGCVSGGSTCFVGLLDEVAVYGTALGPDRILAHCKAIPSHCP